MLNRENIKLCYDVLTRYGIQHQRNMVIEECAELQKAVCKLFREDTLAHRDNFLEELVDVLVVIQQMLLVERLPDDEVNEMAKVKLERALKDG